MKLATYSYNDKTGVGVIDAGMIYPISSYGFDVGSMNELVHSVPLEELIRSTRAEDAAGVPLSSVKLLAPIPQPEQDVICLGVNYMDHASESAKFHNEEFDGKREEAVYFAKRVNEAVADGDPIDSHPGLVEWLDYEVELALVIGKDAKNVKAADSEQYVFGYTVMNDVSARKIQSAHKQWYFGKSLDGFTPMGPFIVTRDEFEYPPKRKVTSVVNGELRQNSNTELMIFDIPYVIEELSEGITLKAGTIISTGTPSGVGFGMDPPQFLKPGDVVECTVEGIGTLTNTVK